MGLGILSVLTPTPAPPGGLCLRLQVLGRCLAAVAAAHAWLTGRAGRYLAAWALPQFLLLTQGDLQVRGHRGCRGLGGDTKGLDSLLLLPPGAEGRGRAADAAGK